MTVLEAHQVVRMAELSLVVAEALVYLHHAAARHELATSTTSQSGSAEHARTPLNRLACLRLNNKLQVTEQVADELEAPQLHASIAYVNKVYSHFVCAVAELAELAHGTVTTTPPPPPRLWRAQCLGGLRPTPSHKVARHCLAQLSLTRYKLVQPTHSRRVHLDP